MKAKNIRMQHTSTRTLLIKAQRTGMLRTNLTILSVSLAALCNPVFAIGLGSATTQSRVGGPLRIEILLQSLSSDLMEASCLRLAPPPSNYHEELPWLRQAKLKLETHGNQQVLVITANSNQHPALMLGIQVGCGAELRRDYTLLLNPPSYEAVSAPVFTTPIAPQVSAASTPATPPNRSSGLLITSNGDTARSLANKLYPSDTFAQRRMARALLLKNAIKLNNLRGTYNRLPAGIELEIPPLPATLPLTTPPLPETSPRAEQNTLKQENALAVKPSTVKRKVRNRLIVSTAGEESSLQLSSSIENRKELNEDQRSRLRTELQLIASLDEKIASQLELADRLRQLEAMQTRLKEDADRLENEIRIQQSLTRPSATTTSSSASPPPATIAKTASAPQQSWLERYGAYFGIIAILVLSSAIALWVRIRNRAGKDNPDTLIHSGDGSEEFGEHLITPLSEADIWPDQEGHAPQGSGRTPSNMEGALGALTASGLGPASMLQIVEDDLEEHDSAVELAEIMMSFGRVHGAAQTLADFIRANPKQAVKPWIKLLEVYRAADMQTEYEALTSQLNKTFNVRTTGWDEFEIARQAPESLENMPHIMEKIDALWGKRECQVFLHGLLRDNRQGTRQGFPLAIIDEILLLLGILESQIGAYRADSQENTVQQASTILRPKSQLAPPLSVPPIPFEEAQATPQPMLSTPSLNEAPKSSFNSTESITQLDFELDMADLTKTLHLNLDELNNDPNLEH